MSRVDTFFAFLIIILILLLSSIEANTPPRGSKWTPVNETQATTPIPPTTLFRSTPTTSSSEIKGEDLLTRINERLTALHVLDEQKLKRLESLEYKITRIEVSHQERSDALRADMRELARRVQNLDWLTTKTENTLDQMRNEVEGIRVAVDDSGKRTGVNSRHGTSFDLPGKLDELSVMIASTRSGVFRLERDLLMANNNLTIITNTTREIHHVQRSIPTKQFLNNAILSLKSQPIYVNLQNAYDPSPDFEVPSKHPPLPSSCIEASPNQSGIYKLQLLGRNQSPFYGLCELVQNVPWLVIQNRVDGSLSFFKPWQDFVNGFGSLSGEFWIGLERLHQLTSNEIHELLILLEDFDGNKRYAHYSAFVVAGEKEQFTLSVLGQYNGTAGDSFSYHAGNKFSAYDLDNDGWQDGNCAQTHTGAWWYNACDMSNLNGRYLNGDLNGEQDFQGMYWNDFRGSSYSLKTSKMLIRPISSIAGVIS